MSLTVAGVTLEVDVLVTLALQVLNAITLIGAVGVKAPQIYKIYS